MGFDQHEDKNTHTKIGFSIDRGGTFTDIYAEVPGLSPPFTVMKLLSEDPSSYPDAPREGIRRILEQVLNKKFPADQKLDSAMISYIRMGTTVATNALLERKGERIALVVTKGFKDFLHIGNQSRPKIFDLRATKPELLYESVVEVDERVRLVRPNGTTEEIAGLVDSDLKLGSTGEKLAVLREPDVTALARDLKRVYDSGVRSVAVTLMHSFTFSNHERIVGEIARKIGFTHVSLSSSIMPMVKIVPRGFTSCADAYLTPVIHAYVSTFIQGFDDKFMDRVKVQFMQSDGGLTSVSDFNGFRAVLSGPAGGVVGYAKTSQLAFPNEDRAVIGFDMGGTSTDVSRFDKHFEHIFENITAGVPIQAPQLDINTVAAGGGSLLSIEAGIPKVGPESAGAFPGPVCYRRKGGKLAVTDANLILGRLMPEHFPAIFGESQNLPLDREHSRAAFQELVQAVNDEQGTSKSLEEVALGFIEVANEAMCRPIRALTQAKGFDTTTHVLSCFGGAGGQHACAIARTLGIRTIFIHRFAGILSAYGMGLADVVFEHQEPCADVFEESNFPDLQDRLTRVREKGAEGLLAQGFSRSSIVAHVFLNLRFEGTDTALMLEVTDALSDCDYRARFVSQYQREFGFVLEARVIVDDVRCRCVATPTGLQEVEVNQRSPDVALEPLCTTQCFFKSGYESTSVFKLDQLKADDRIIGPSIILDKTSTILVEPDCTATITKHGHVCIAVGEEEKKPISTECDVILLSIFGHRFMSIAEQMGRALQRTAISTNIKERLDFSCAIFGPDGGLVANAPHLPVHLGAMQEAVKFQRNTFPHHIRPGDVIVSNHPSAGGSHLPDITVITPVFDDSREDPVFFVAARGHHSDIGGISPGSMPPFSKFLYQEGAAIMSFRLVKNGVFDEAGISEILTTPVVPAHLNPGDPEVKGTRNLAYNLSDLRAQVAANQKGIVLLKDLIKEYSLEVVQAYMFHIQDNAERAVRDMLRKISDTHNLGRIGTLKAVDYMDDGTPLRLAITIDREAGSAHIDFSGTGPQVYGNVNCPPSVTKSAVIYCLRCLVDQEIPLNEGCLKPVTITIPDRSILNPLPTAAVVGGNVLTSQRITDVILKAFRACAASQGCMNNLTFGDDTFGYYETICGGAGAGPTWNGTSGIHTHMTNTRITDPEILERRLPVLLREFSLRPGSGGNGKYRGGDGVVREIEFLRPLAVGILSERRSFRPYGMAGGEDAERGFNLIRTKEGVDISLGAKNTYYAQKGDAIRICTPGGGGYGNSMLQDR
eukprot:116238_1